MLLKFADDARQSYEEGSGKPFLKENEPFEVNQLEGARLLNVTAKTRKDKKFVTVNVFAAVEGKEAATFKKEKVAELTKKSKAELVAKAEAEGVEVVPDSQTKEEIATAIIEENE